MERVKHEMNANEKNATREECNTNKMQHKKM